MTPKLRSTTMAPKTYAKREISAAGATFEGRDGSKMTSPQHGTVISLMKYNSRPVGWEKPLQSATQELRLQTMARALPRFREILQYMGTKKGLT
ncbi:hypothetical protein AKJ16_DCAP07698 [Drosera capensis]